ncbi:hypothetical protein LZG00_01750 [Rhodobacteraceae bacterium LMO-12]|nr:hypothetical protein [Rhodobacteraceae bacterium LMO-JJ12]
MSAGYSGNDVQAFLDYLADKGLGKVGTMRARRIAVGRVMEAIGEEDFSDVRKIDLDNIMQRFANLEGAKFTPDSLRTYKSRVSTAVADFLRYKEDPTGFKITSQRTTKKTAASDTAVPVQPKPIFGKNNTVDAGQINNSNGIDVLELPIPIRPDVIVRIVGLPHDLKAGEAQKIANVINAMTMIEE